MDSTVVFIVTNITCTAEIVLKRRKAGRKCDRFIDMRHQFNISLTVFTRIVARQEIIQIRPVSLLKRIPHSSTCRYSAYLHKYLPNLIPSRILLPASKTS